MGEKKIITKEDLIKALQKMLDDQKKVSAFLRGEISRKELEKYSIKLGNPIK